MYKRVINSPAIKIMKDILTKLYVPLLVFFVAIGAIFGYLNYMRFAGRGEAPQVTQPVSSSQQFVLENGEKLNVPDSQTSPAEVQEFVSRIRALSEETAVIDISGCDPKPKFSKINGDKFALQNKDTATHTVIFNEGQFNVPAKSSTEVSSSIFRPGVHGFGCDNAGSNMAVGFIDLD